MGWGRTGVVARRGLETQCAQVGQLMTSRPHLAKLIGYNEAARRALPKGQRNLLNINRKCRQPERHLESGQGHTVT